MELPCNWKLIGEDIKKLTQLTPSLYLGTNGLLYTSCFWGTTTGNEIINLTFGTLNV